MRLGAPPVYSGRFYNRGAAYRKPNPFRTRLGKFMMRGQLGDDLGWLTRLGQMSGRRALNLGGFGQGPTNEELETYLNHERVPRIGGRAKRIADIVTRAEVQKYASNGFHVSVERGQQATNRTIKLLWARAAFAYFVAYNSDPKLPVGCSPAPCTSQKTFLQAADASADIAQLNAENRAAIEKKTPPEPPPKPAEPAAEAVVRSAPMEKSKTGLYLGLLAAAGILGGAILLSKKRKKA